MSSPYQRPSGFKDIVHAVILLCAVPVLFFGAYTLLTKTQDMDEPVVNPPVVIQYAMQKAEPLLTKAFPPAPGETWLTKIQTLELKLADILLTHPEQKDAIANIRQRLGIVRNHCEEYIDDVPPETADKTLGVTLAGIGQEIDSLSEGGPRSPVVDDLEQQFEAVSRDQHSKQSQQIRETFEKQSNPIVEKHKSQLASIKQANREAEDRLQQLKDQSNRILLSMEEQIAKNARRKEFEPDRAEIQRLLSPFISPGYSQLGELPQHFEKSAEAKPLSYGDLERVGAMEPTIKGLTALGHIGTHSFNFENNVRPIGAFPVFNEFTFKNPAQLETVKRAQALLRKHSTYLIETGLLLP